MTFEQFCTWQIGIICHLFSAGMGRRVKGQGFRSHLTLFKVWKMENVTGPRTNVLLVLLHKRVGVHMSELFFFFFKCSWYTVLYQFLLYSTVTQSHTHTHAHTHIRFLILSPIMFCPQRLALVPFAVRGTSLQPLSLWQHRRSNEEFRKATPWGGGCIFFLHALRFCHLLTLILLLCSGATRVILEIGKR